ncbi:hypothetical protein DFH07DRAFT_1017029 [Mycena maculata]|uniref:Transmembrane protein n=1 Tax=Mycena maculata TaxID=230809 RepID=A0AAD7NKD1_9AGAR|nr:hypothetical protein DFH07DRAFT_1017029 [Mycena maculata]
MRVFATCLWHLSLLLLTSAVLTNHTIDDQAPTGVAYYPATIRNTSLHNSFPGINDDLNFNGTQLYNGTISYFPSKATNDTFIIDVNFSGNAIYVFAAMPSISSSDSNALSSKDPADCRFFIDGVSVFNYSTEEAQDSYNISVYSNSSIPDGAHTLRMTMPDGTFQGNFFAFDYVIYTANDPDPTSSLGGSTSGGGGSSMSSFRTPSSSVAAASVAAAVTERKTLPISSIAGGIAGGTAAFLAFGVGFLLCRRARRRRRKVSLDLEETTPTAPTEAETEELSHPDTSQPSYFPTTSDPAAIALAQELRTLKEEFNQFRQNAEGSSTAMSEITSVTRSLSTMKRDQTRALQDHQDGYGGADALVHTDSGLRLTAGRRMVDELPPTYMED